MVQSLVVVGGKQTYVMTNQLTKLSFGTVNMTNNTECNMETKVNIRI